MTREEKLRIWLAQGQERLTDSADDGVTALLQLAISGLEKELRGEAVNEYEACAFRVTFVGHPREDATIQIPHEAIPSLEELRAKRMLYSPT